MEPFELPGHGSAPVVYFNRNNSVSKKKKLTNKYSKKTAGTIVDRIKY